MGNIDLQKEFEKIEQRIAEDAAKNRDITGLLRAKVRLLKVAYSQLSEAVDKDKPANIAPLFARELAFLNNIKDIQNDINEDISETNAEIEKVHAKMYENGLGWILENMPEKVEPEEN